MRVDFDIQDHQALLKFPLDSFTSDRDFEQALTLVVVVSADFNIDPEIDLEQFQDLVQANQDPEKKFFEVEINEEGLSAQFL